MLEEIAGHDERDSTSSNVSIPNYSKQLNSDLNGKTIGIPKEYTVDGISDEINAVWDNAIKSLEKKALQLSIFLYQIQNTLCPLIISLPQLKLHLT